MFRRFRRSSSDKDMKKTTSSNTSRSRYASDSSPPTPSTGSSRSSFSESPPAPKPKKYSAAERKIKDEKDLCKKYDSCSDYEDLKKSYLKSFCRDWSTKEKRDLEHFLDFAKEERLVSHSTTLDDIKSLCRLYETTL